MHGLHATLPFILSNQLACTLRSSIKEWLWVWQVFPLLIEKFSFEEQASLVWQFLCSIPVRMMAEFLPWLSSSISSDECQDMRKCLNKIIPEEKLLQQVRSIDIALYAWNRSKFCFS